MYNRTHKYKQPLGLFGYLLSFRGATTKFIFFITAILLVNSSCSNDYGDLGDKVLSRYQHENDSLKKRAALFLLDNMRYHAYPYSSSIIKGKEWYKFLREVPYERLHTVRDSLSVLFNPYEKAQYKLDICELDSSYICDNIDLAYKVWQEQPWGKNVDFEMFCEYILPYRIGDEIPERWRKHYYEKYNPLLNEFINSGEYDVEDPVEAVKFLLAKVPLINDPRYTTFSFMNFPHIGPHYVQYMSGTCREFSDYLIYICRSLGIPCAFNETVNMHRSNQGHQWVSFWNKNGEEFIISNYPPEIVPNRQDYTLGSSKCKVFRQTFSLNERLYDKGKRNRFALRPRFRYPTYRDMTATYTNTYISDLTIPSSKLKGPISWNEPIYLCSSSRTTWIPEDYSFKSLRGVHFSNLQTGEVMCLCIDSSGEMCAISNPFEIDVDTHRIKYLSPSDSLQSVTLLSKYISTVEETTFRDRMVGGLFEGSNNRYFQNADTLHIIGQRPERRLSIVKVDKVPLKTYRFLRYKGPDGGYCNVSEITFFDENRKILYPQTVFGTLTSEPGHDYSKVFDGNTLTSFVDSAPSGGWIGIELKQDAYIGYISYTPRNRDNFINTGEHYELLYFDYRWKSLGRKVAYSDSLVYDNVPKDCILLLKNHSNGIQERIFTYKGGRQIWK